MKQVLIGLTTLVGLLLCPQVRATDLNPIGFSSKIRWENDQFFVLGRSQLYTSTDGGNWQKHGLPDSTLRNNVLDVLYIAPHYFVMSEQKLYAGESLNQLVELPSNLVGASAMTWDGSRLYATRYDGLYTSQNGATWTRQIEANVWNLAQGNGATVAVGIDLITSTDGSNFQKQVLTGFTGVVAFGAGQFVIGAYDGVYYSSDSHTWTKVVLGGNSDFNEGSKLIFDGERFHYFGVQSRYTSVDGVNWALFEDQTMPEPFLNDVAATPDLMVSLNDHHLIFSRTPLSSWKRRNTGSLDVVDLNNFGEHLVVVNRRNVLLTEDTSTFDTYTPPASWKGDLAGSIVADNKLLVYGPGIAVTADGINWQTSAVGGPIADMSHDGKQFIAVGKNGLLATSPDGLQWTAQQVGYENLHAIASVNGVSLLNNGFGSTEGRHWKPMSPAAEQTFGLAGGNGRFLMTTNRWLSMSRDGHRFNNVPRTYAPMLLKYRGGLFWLGQQLFTGDWVWDWSYSKNGTDWVDFLFDAPDPIQFTLFQGRRVQGVGNSLVWMDEPQADPITQRRMVIPWVVDNATWQSRVVLSHLGDTETDVILTAYPEQGEIRSEQFTLQPQEVFTKAASDLFPGLTRYSLVVQSDNEAVLPTFLTYADTGLEVLAPSQTVGVFTDQLNSQLVFPYVPGDEVSALVLSAPDLEAGQSGEAILTLRDASGTALGETSLSLQGPRPIAQLLSLLFPDQTIPADAAVTVSATTPIAGVTFVFNEDGQPSMAAAHGTYDNVVED